MDAKLILILLLAIVAAAFVAALVVVLARSRGRGGQMLERSTAAATARPSLGEAVVTHKQINVKFGGELLEMLSSGRRDEVLRLVRERAGIGEAEAEAVVAKLETVMGRLKK